MDFAIHKLILSRSTLEPFSRELHRVAAVVDVRQDLHGDHGVYVLRHVVDGREMADHIVAAATHAYEHINTKGRTAR